MTKKSVEHDERKERVLVKIADPNVREYVHSAIDDLEERALWLITEFEEFRKKGNANKKPIERSILSPRLRGRRCVTSLLIVWKYTTFHRRTDGGVNAWSTELNKGRGTYIYKRTTLQSKAQPWEIDEAYRIEQEFAKLRKAAEHVRRMWFAHGEHIRLMMSIDE